MDEEDTDGFKEPCNQCAAVDWGISDEGRFYCRSCHNVIERTREVVDMSFTSNSNRVSRICNKSRTRKAERGYVWMLCEGFQFILQNQADALLRLGVAPQFKDDVLCQMWRLYLQKSQQGYTRNPVRNLRFRGVSFLLFITVIALFFVWSSSDWLGSDYSGAGTSSSWKRSRSLMTMKKTLALIHLALVWSREALTLSDLLRLVKEGHVPYVTAYEDLPEEMKLCGPDALLFHVEGIPSHRSVHKEAQVLVQFLQLPAFPPIVPEALLHPAPLSLRYLTDANLPDELHRWVCVLLDRAGMADQKRHTLDGGSRLVLPRYDLQAAALIIVTVKVMFGLDDHLFSFRKWYKLVQAALGEAQASNLKVYMTSFAEQPRLSSFPAVAHHVSPSSFQFCWGDEDGSDGPSLHHTKLDGIISLSNGFMTPLNLNYWHPPLRPCNPRSCTSHYPSMEPTLPRSFVWLLQLFSFMLDVEAWYLFDEVQEVERRVFGIKTPLKQNVQTQQRGKSSGKNQKLKLKSNLTPDYCNINHIKCFNRKLSLKLKSIMKIN
uniref:TATA box-binding protein-associated factor RNA polymerase I subunit B n=1 Tax=Poecilia reticulata TaxID=8081 RepID=A0A3P9PJJ0_POERE